MRRQFSATCGVFMCSSPKWGILSILKFGRSREQHVADSFNHSLYLFKNCSTPATLRETSWTECHDLHVSIVPRLHENVHSSGTVHHLSGPDMFALTRCAVYVRCVGMCSVFVVCYWCFVRVFGCVCRCASLCVVVCVWLWCVAHTLKITVFKNMLM